MSEMNAVTLTAEAFEAWQAGAPKDQIAAKMLNAAICLSVEQIGLLKTMDGLFCVLSVLSEGFPREFETLRFMHTPHLTNENKSDTH